MKGFFRYLAAVSMAAIPLLSLGQTTEEIEEKMDEIKMNADYLYGEGHGSNREIAFDNALIDLLMTANDLRAQENKEELKTTDLLTVVEEYVYDQDGYFTYFVYIPSSRILAMVSKRPGDQQGSAPSQATAQPAPAPVPAPAVPQPDSPPAPAYEANVPTPTPVAEPEPEPEPPKPIFVSNSQAAAASAGDLADLARSMAGQGSWIEVRTLLSQYKNLGKLREDGRLAYPGTIPDDAYAILMDDKGGILAILSPRESSGRTDFVTRRIVDPMNYPSCRFIVWYK